MRSLRDVTLLAVLVAAVLVLAGGSSGAPDRLASTGAVYVVSVGGGAPRALAAGHDPSVSPDGRSIAYLRGGQIWLMRSDGTEQRQVTTRGGGRPFWSPDGRRLLYTVWNLDPCSPGPAQKCAITDIWTVNADGTGEQKLVDRALQPSWSPDGRRILFRDFLGPAEADMGVGALKVASSDGSHVRTLFRGATYDGTRSQPAWSPNGEWIAFEKARQSDLIHAIYLVRADGSHLRRLASGAYPAWSPNGKLVAFERDQRVGRSRETGAWIIPVAGRRARRIRIEAAGDHPARGRCPTWSPRGNTLALVTTVYRSQAEPQPPLIDTTLSVARPDGKGRRKLAGTDPCVFESSFPAPPSWSPEGRSIYFSG